MKVATPLALVVAGEVVITDAPEPAVNETLWPDTGLPLASFKVTVIVEELDRPKKTMSIDEIFAARRPPFRSVEDIDRQIRELRDEWDD